MLIILDRDGVINFESEAYVKSPSEWIPITGSLEAIAQLSQAGHKIVIATNQAGVGRGYYTEATLHEIHRHMKEKLARLNGKIEAIYYCPHHPDEECDCRKPKPGMLKKISNDFPDDFSNAIYIGDSWRDYEAAKTMKCQFALVKTGFGETTLAKKQIPSSITVYDSLQTFTTELLIKKEKQTKQIKPI